MPFIKSITLSCCISCWRRAFSCSGVSVGVGAEGARSVRDWAAKEGPRMCVAMASARAAASAPDMRPRRVCP